MNEHEKRNKDSRKIRDRSRRAQLRQLQKRCNELNELLRIYMQNYVLKMERLRKENEELVEELRVLKQWGIIK